MNSRLKRDPQATRSALLDAAEYLFEKQGVSRTTLTDIARHAKLTRGAIYWHFKDKVDLFNAMLERVTLPLQSGLEGLCDGPCDPMDILMRRICMGVSQIATDEQTRRVLQIATLMVEHVDELGAVRERRIVSQQNNVKKVIQAMECAAQRRQQKLALPACQLAHGLHALVLGLINDWLIDSNFDLAQVTQVGVQAYLQGVGLPPLEHETALLPANMHASACCLDAE